MKNLLFILFIFLFSFNSYAAKWTVLCYFNGDTKGWDEYYGLLQINRLERYFPENKDMNIIVQFDRIEGWNDTDTEPDPDWVGAKRIKIKRSELSNLSIESDIVKDLGEVDMTNSDTLKDFLIWADENYPADNYILFVTKEVGEWQIGASAKRGVSVDVSTSSKSFLSSESLKNALKGFYDSKNKKINIVVLDGSYTASVEFAYDIKDYADYFIGRETEQKTLGIGYHYWLDLVNNDKYSKYLNTPSTMTKLINKADISYHKKYYSSSPSVLSIIDLSKISELKNDMDELILNTALNYKEITLTRILDRTFKFNEWTSTKFDYCDILSFTRSIKYFMHFNPVKESATKIESFFLDKSYTNINYKKNIKVPITIKIYNDTNISNSTSLLKYSKIFNKSEFQFVNKPQLNIKITEESKNFFEIKPSINSDYLSPHANGWIASFNIVPTSDHSYCPSTDIFKKWSGTIEIEFSSITDIPALDIYSGNLVTPYFQLSGLSLFFPNYKPTANIMTEYSKFSLSKDSYIDEVISIHYNMDSSKLVNDKVKELENILNRSNNINRIEHIKNELLILGTGNVKNLKVITTLAKERKLFILHDIISELKQFFYMNDRKKYNYLNNIFNEEKK